MAVPLMTSRWSEQQRRYYDASAEEYAECFQQDNPYFRFVAGRFVRAIAPSAKERLLELGASGGRFTAPLLEAGCRVTAVDLSQKSLDFLAHRLRTHLGHGRLSLIADDAASLKRLEGERFDAVVGGHILHHIERLEAALKRSLELLRPGGRAVFLEPNPWNPLWAIQNTFDPTRSWSVERGQLRMFPGRVRRLFVQDGFESCRVECFGFFPPQALNRWPRLQAVDERLERVPLLRRLLTLNLFTARKTG